MSLWRLGGILVGLVVVDGAMIFSLLKKITPQPKSNHSAHYAKQLQELKSLKPLDAIQYSHHLLAELSEDKDLTRQEYQFLLYEVDHLNQINLADLILQLITENTVDREQLMQAEAIISPYCRRLFLELMVFAEQMQLQLAQGQANHAIFAEHLCRTLNMGLHICKWRYFDDQPAPSSTWFNLHRLYQFAETASVLYEPVRLQHIQPSKTDFASNYIAALMLSTLHKGNYSAQELQIASTLLPLWFQGVAIEKGYAAEKHQYFMDLNADQGAERMRARAKISDGRYWKTADVVSRVDAYLEAMRAKTLPKNSRVRMHGSLVILYPLFKKLSQEWSVTHYRRQRRNAERVKLEKKILVMHGLEQICDYLALHKKAYSIDLNNHLTDVAQKSKNELALTEHALSKMQSLWVVDESEHGLGIHLGVEKPVYMQAGRLIGCWHPSAQEQFVLAEIKQVRKQKNGHYRAGLQIISAQVMLVKLSKLEHQAVELSQGFYLHDAELVKQVQTVMFDCLFIPAHKGQHHANPSVIIPSSEYELRRQFSLMSGGEEATIEIGVPMAKQADWVRASIASIN